MKVIDLSDNSLRQRFLKERIKKTKKKGYIDLSNDAIKERLKKEKIVKAFTSISNLSLVMKPFNKISAIHALIKANMTKVKQPDVITQASFINKLRDFQSLSKRSS